MAVELLKDDFRKLDVKQVHELLDELYLELLNLIEQLVQCKVNIERITNEGRINCAKARYLHGAQSVGISQLPTEDSPDFNALVRIEEVGCSSAFSDKRFELKRYSVDKDAGFIDPTRWFGILIPRPLQTAKQKFEMSLELIIEAANIQRQISNIIIHIKKLNEQKTSLLSVK